MLGDVNKKFRAGKNKLANDQLIVESVVDDMDDLDEDEVMELVNGIDKSKGIYSIPIGRTLPSTAVAAAQHTPSIWPRAV